MIDETLSGRHTAFDQLDGPHTLGGGASDPEACQARVLEQWRRSETLLEVNLSTGPTIYGTLLAFDRFMIAVLHQGKLQAIYKHAILALAPIAIAPTDDEVITRPIPYLKRQEGSEPR